MRIVPLDVTPPPPSGYTADYLKRVAGQAKIYIRPLQKDLDLTPDTWKAGQCVVLVSMFHCSVLQTGGCTQLVTVPLIAQGGGQLL